MSVITTRNSTVLSILKNKDSSRTSLHRVRFKLPNNVRKIFLDYKKGVNAKEYEDLVCTIRDSEMCDDELLALLEEAKNCVNLLNYDLRLFVQALILIGWTYRSEAVVRRYQEFFSSLVSAHTQHAKTVIDQLVKIFGSGEESEWDDCRPSSAQQLQFANIHQILKSIVQTIPMSEELLFSCIKNNFPYLNASPIKQLCYMYNVLQILNYLPHCRREILHLLVDKLVLLDVNIPRDEILPINDSTIFPMDNEPLSSSSTLIDALDNGMTLLFRFLDETCRPNGELKWMEAKHLFGDLNEILDKSLLTVHGCEHVQFLCFYLTSFKSTLAQGFLNLLWKKILSTNLAPVVRKLAVAYLASYLARASFLSLGFLKTYLSEMTVWVHKYIKSLDPKEPVTPTVHVHGVFYAVCQSIFYVIAFRHKDLVDSRKKLVFLQSLNLSQIVTCSLNPLHVCNEAVVEKFAAIAKDYQLAYCYSVIEENARHFTKPAVLDAIFPFDPYLLPRSGKFIQNIYLDYGGGVDLTENSMKTDIKGCNEEDDDFIKDGERKQHNRGIDISCSSSPGFKPMSL